MDDMMTISREEYEALVEDRESLADLQAYDRATAALEAGEDELIPAEYADRLMNGENALRVYREMRGLTQQALSHASGVNRVQIANIESDQRQGSVGTLKRLAAALGLSISDLV